MLNFIEIESLVKKKKNKHIIFPEGQEPLIVQVANKLVINDICNVTIVVEKKADILKNVDKKINILVMEDIDTSDFANKLFELRKNKITLDEAKKLIKKRTYYATMMMHENLVDCMVCGLTFTTADTLRPALQIVKIDNKYSLAASVFIMSNEHNSFLFTDCALNIDPSAEQLADIAFMAANFAKNLNEKKVETALLSYSTNGSGSGLSVDKVKKAVEILQKKQQSDLVFDGEIQFDAALINTVRNKKYPSTKLTKTPNVFVFPEINSGNIGYKIAQRLGGYKAAGPFILGLKKPINDLSRGATVEDIYQTAIYTLFMVKGE